MESRLIVHSWDFDGMLASEAYTTELKRLIIAAAADNRALNMEDYAVLANFILNKYSNSETNNDFFGKKFLHSAGTENIVFVGSDRQDVITDLNNGFKVGREDLYVTLSCYPFFKALIPAIANKYQVNITLNTLLLEDIYRGVPTGTSYDMIVRAYLENLSPDFYKDLASQLTKKGSDPWSLFDKMEIAVTGNTKKNRDDSKFPKYTDKSKLLPMFAQILNAHASVGKGRTIDYCYADDRFDILSTAEKNLVTFTPYIPAGTNIYLEQFIPQETKDALLKQSTENLYFADYKQTTSIAGTGRQAEDFDIIARDIIDTHQRLNKVFDDPAPEILMQTISKRAQEKAIMHIQHCVNDLSNIKTNGIEKIAGYLKKYSAGKITTAAECLAKIIKVANKILPESETSKKATTLYKENPRAASFYLALRNLDPNNPNTQNLEAAYYVVHNQTAVPASVSEARKSSTPKF